MPKAEKGSVKDIANRMKAKGLQKLKYYCQMCQKQCRDANGFKCHLTSENHLRQMKIFSGNAGGILDQYSKDFEKSYISTLRMRHGTKKVNANNVYQELIQDKQHIHMNATHWTTLTEFVQYLGKTGKCVVEENERGWFVSYIERDASILARQEAHQRREEADRAAEEAQTQRMELQRVEAAKALDKVGASVHVEATALERTDEKEILKITLKPLASDSSAKANGNNLYARARAPVAEGFGEQDEDDKETEEIPPSVTVASVTQAANNHFKKRQHGEVQDVTWEKKTKTKEKSSLHSAIEDRLRIENWLYEGIMVRVISKELSNGKYFRRKAVVDRLVDKFTAEVELLDSSPDARDGGDILRLDQQDLETVIPKRDDRKQKVRILIGKYRGCKARVESLNKKNYCADLRLSQKDGHQLLCGVPFEDFSQME